MSVWDIGYIENLNNDRWFTDELCWSNSLWNIIKKHIKTYKPHAVVNDDGNKIHIFVYYIFIILHIINYNGGKSTDGNNNLRINRCGFLKFTLKMSRKWKCFLR